MANKEDSQIVFLGTFPPRECGIATFTQDISNAVQQRVFPDTKVKIAAMNRNGVNIYNYPERVIFQLNDLDLVAYVETARRINRNRKIKLVTVQHEFGIFGGECGSYLLDFLSVLEKPCVITLHSILPNPDARMKRVVREMAEKSSAFIVMAEKGKEILRSDYELGNDIYVVPHGIPSVSFESSAREKRNLGYKNNLIVSSFGMISPGKGYELVIDSLPKVVERFPNLLYLIVGETHPIVRKEQGESYRNELEKRVRELGLQNNVKFYNKYMTLSEIVKYLKASDIYISSSKDLNQITSGTLVYALGVGRPVVSTPFLHAQEVVDSSRGVLIDFGEKDSFSDALIKILSDEKIRKSMSHNAYHYTRQMTWPNVALNYEKIFNKYADISSSRILPKIKMNHVNRLTDGFGIVQFARNVVPDRDSGYTTDDNARAMIVCCEHYKNFGESSKLNLIRTYLNYLAHVQDFDGKFMNYVDKNRKIDRVRFTEDAHGRAVWALGCLLATPHLGFDVRKRALKLFKKSLSPVSSFTSPRAIAFVVVGLSLFNSRKPTQENIELIRNFSDRLVAHYRDNSVEGWDWFEKYLTYSNSKLSEALFYAYQETGDEKYRRIAEKTLDFLMGVTFENEMFVPIGQRGWYVRNGERAYYDQQPVDVAYMVQTLIVAGRVTGRDEYMDKALSAFQWFLGRNSLKQVVYNEVTGGCYDGLGEHAVNINQGAESTVSYLMARLAFCC
jgi:glycosyltransferase involved in cell wall biosynthesis